MKDPYAAEKPDQEFQCQHEKTKCQGICLAQQDLPNRLIAPIKGKTLNQELDCMKDQKEKDKHRLLLQNGVEIEQVWKLFFEKVSSWQEIGVELTRYSQMNSGRRKLEKPFSAF